MSLWRIVAPGQPWDGDEVWVAECVQWPEEEAICMAQELIRTDYVSELPIQMEKKVYD